jgi:hypothetical protein
MRHRARGLIREDRRFQDRPLGSLALGVTTPVVRVPDLYPIPPSAGGLGQGRPEPVKPLHSRRDDVTLANPLGPLRRGWTEVEDAIEQAAANFRGGGGVRYEEVSRYVTPELADVVRVERTETKVGGHEQLSPVSLRVTMIFRREATAGRSCIATPTQSPPSSGGVGHPELANQKIRLTRVGRPLPRPRHPFQIDCQQAALNLGRGSRHRRMPRGRGLHGIPGGVHPHED